ncbi:MAG TPA: hypothetical protein ENF26_02255 [Methanomicrobia archaeon]|nr:hypothetical protein [Methanomicrobia archaeon]HEX58954.1 hypothetical protein [Methanomicrobia archaeon]
MTLDAERLKIIRELRDFFEEYDRGLPEWLREQRAQARRIFLEYEERGFPAGRHGMDFDLLAYRPDIARKHKPRKSLAELDDEMKKIAESAGQRIDERGVPARSFRRTPTPRISHSRKRDKNSSKSSQTEPSWRTLRTPSTNTHG